MSEIPMTVLDSKAKAPVATDGAQRAPPPLVWEYRSEGAALERAEIVDFLYFVDLLWKFKIPTVHASILEGGDIASATTGTLGRGGQYAVDKIYDNQW